MVNWESRGPGLAAADQADALRGAAAASKQVIIPQG